MSDIQDTSKSPPALPEEAGAKESEGNGTKKTSYGHLFRLLHWTLAASLPVMAVTGLSLHAAAPPGWSLFKSFPVQSIWQGQVHLVHFIAAVFFASSVLAVACIYARRKRRRPATHLILVFGGLAMFASAVILLDPMGPPVVYRIARLVHAVLGLAVLPAAYLWHLGGGLGRYRLALWPAFHPWDRPRWRHVTYLLPVPIIVACVVFNGLPIVPARNVLTARRIEPAGPPVADLAELPWKDAQALSIELANGAALDGGRTQVTLRALHDGEELFILAEWSDPTEDRRYQPWEKTSDGWKHLVSNFEDESVFYEDKFSLAFPIKPDWRFDRVGCAMYCHLGGGRAYGYKGASQTVDVWHWKATRTDTVDQVDDKYWTEADFSHKDFGRRGDPKESGGYKKNFSDEKSHPDFLPDSLDLPELKEGIIPTSHAVPYTAEAAAEIPDGEIIPGIVASAVIGDRGDVPCKSQYEHAEGRWKLYIHRKLDTGSKYDVLFEPGEAYSFGCAAFDHTSKRHAYGLVPYRLVLEE